MDHNEIEVKYYLEDPGAIRDRILEIGAVSCGRVFETNVRYEDEGKTLIQKKQLLRHLMRYLFQFVPWGQFQIIGLLY